MKKNVLKILGGLCVATLAAGLASCSFLPSGPIGGTGNSSSSKPNSSVTTPTVTYTLNSDSFDKEVVFGSTLNAQGLTIKASTGETIAVNNAMVSGWNTDSVGEKTLTVKYEGATVGTVKYTVKYEVKFVVDGQVVKTQLVTEANEVTYPADPQKEGFEFDGWSTSTLETLTGNLTITAQFKGEEPLEKGTIAISGDAVYVREFGEDGQLALTASFGALAAKDYEIELSNENITYTKGRNLILIKPVKAGVTTLTVKVDDPATGDELTATKTIIVKPRSLMINEVKLGSSDIEGIYTLGRTDVSGQVSEFTFSVSCGTQEDVGAGLLDNIVWVSNSQNVNVSNEGKVTLAQGSGVEMVSLTAKFVVSGVEYDFSDAYTVRCVYDAVNVGSYNDLYAATKAGKAIVLNQNIAFPTNVAEIKYDTMRTTYDDTYYTNIGKPNDATIITLLQFKNNLYGNGYQVNAHNATLGLLDGSGAVIDTTLFKGPLDFVAMSQSGSSIISVKGQDNVCFALFEGVTVNNVELRGCDLKANSDGNYDLTKLNYAGTTVEVFGDNVTIEYSRITNGRTVLRIFGDATDSEKAIHVDIKNSVLSGAREFILRMGSNRFVPGTDAAISPYIDAADPTALLAKSKYNVKNDNGTPAMSAAEKEAYEKKYINTFVNVKNSVFKDAGIFAVGIDTHFAGNALHKGHEILGESSSHWSKLAKTSYGAKLTFEGDVRMYNWKPLDQIDSSTLIEIMPSAPEELREKLEFNVGEMVGKVAAQDKFSSVIANYNGKDYVHAGIAFFGGGKNYGVFENSVDAEMLESFEVSLAEVDKGFLTEAAGQEKFLFMLCTKNSTFSPEKQEEVLNSEDAYACLKK